ncbi:MAG: YHYH protein [Flavobacteriales bacterium]|nr:YHYH protein [Flavobacteriales bacterium]
MIQTKRIKLIAILVAIISLGACKKDADVEEVSSGSNPGTTLEEPDLTHLPFGGESPNNILIQNEGDPQPDFLSLWLCGLPANGAGNSNAADWTNPDGSWNYDLKPQVEGNMLWPHELEIYLDGNGNRIISGNGLPDHPTGIFPVTPGSAAYQYDGNPNVISPQNVQYVFDAMPVEASQPSCVPFGPSGISLTGCAIYHGSSTLGNDAAAHEMLDRFGGHTDGTERYHYHYPSDDLMDHIQPHNTGHSPLTGYMLDGFGIYGPYGENGELLTSADLDECHGHKHPVMWDGEMVDIYHYHWTYDFPYNIGCFKGNP